jgi:uncharacterized repeat protein (TIGR03803 family)
MRAKAIVVLTFLLFAVSSGGQAGNQKVLYTFTGGVDGSQPYQAGVIFDPAGNLYGVTQYGGAYGQGTVFQLTPSTNGAWTETVLHSFTGGTDGLQPQGGLAIDGAGNLYGTTSWGGDPNAGCGTVFKLSPSDNGWTFNVLHAFTNGQDGCSPQGGNLRVLAGGSIYGTTAGGGAGSQGTVFALYPAWPFYWVWPLRGGNGEFPGGLGGYVPGAANYGTANFGGAHGVGTVFELAGPTGYSIETKHTFNTTNAAGSYPIGDLAGQDNGNGGFMYGVTAAGGVGGYGTVYQLTESQSIYDLWSISVLHSFSGLDGATPWAGVVLDAAGNLYGTTFSRGKGGAGTVFKLTLGAKNTWTHTVLYSFTGGIDGGEPTSGVVFDNAGNLYGTTNTGGAFKQGVVYEVVKTTAVIKPASLTFGPQPLNTASPAQRISLFNTSSIPITDTSVNVQGDFAISANKCQNGVQPDTHCDVYVTYTPTGTGTAPRTGTITFVDTAFNSPQSAPLSGTVPYHTETLVSTSGSPSFVGQAVTFTATVTSTHGTIPDGELVTFYDGTTTLGSAALASGMAAYTTSSLSVKTHSIKATYTGDAAFVSSTGSVGQVVKQYSTTTALSSSSNPSAYGQSATFTATVTSAGPTPTGKVWFKDGTMGIGTVTLNGGVAIFTESKFAVGTHPITAQYLGDGANTKSTSSVLDQVVQ